MFIFERMKKRQRQEEREQQIREEKNRLFSISEKEYCWKVMLKCNILTNSSILSSKIGIY